MTREELKKEYPNGKIDGEYYNKAEADSVMDVMEKDNADLRHNLEDWKCENKALKERIKELEDELQVANRCAEDAMERIAEALEARAKRIKEGM